MDAEIKAALTRVASPLSTFFRKQIILLFDGNGIVRHVESNMYQSYLPGLKPGECIQDHFDISPRSSLKELPEGKGFYFPSRETQGFSEWENFYSVYPLASLFVERAGEDRFFGVAAINSIFPNIQPEFSGVTLLADRSDRLTGFNESFFRYFNNRFRSPEELLLKPLSDFLKPSPAEFQAAGLERDSRFTRNEFRERFRNDFRKGNPPAPLRFVPEGGLTQVEEGLKWHNPAESEKNALIILPVTGKSDQEDAYLSVEFSLVKGQSPLLILGYGDPGRPDEYAYQAGRSPDTAHAVIKKTGYVISSGPSRPEPAGEHASAFCSAGSSLFYEQDGERVCVYFDPHHYPGALTCAALALRPGGECVLKEIWFGMRSQRHASGRDPSDTTVRILTGDTRYYRLVRFYTAGLTSSATYAETAGYLLQDVTPLQHRVERLNRRYQEQLHESKTLRSRLEEQGLGPDSFVGNSPVMQALKGKARLIAGSNATVLIQGDTGTGKEVLAHYIHDHSQLKNGPLIKVDCAALPKDLIESELFGHEKGAFTGALERKIGKFEQAENGTIFLDEVSNLTPAVQAKLLQFLQDFSVTRIGGSAPIPLRVRLIAASNVPLEELVKRGAFREDLYYRLCVMVIHMPPLSERRDDLFELANHFIRVFSSGSGKAPPRLGAEAFRKLSDHSWPGNVRELKNVLQRAVLFSQGGEIAPDHLVMNEALPQARASFPAGGSSSRPGAKHVLSDMTAGELSTLLKKHRGRVAPAAMELSISPRALYYGLERVGIDAKALRREWRGLKGG